MSFYGNSYQYLAETFANIILNNIGLENVEFPTPKIDQIQVSAKQAESGVNMVSGNRWVVVNPYYEAEDPQTPKGVEIWHNSPAIDGELTKIVSDVLPPEASGEGAEAEEIQFEGYLKFPTVTYDQAGHITNASDAIYFKMPKDPTFRLEKRVEEVEKDMVTFKQETTTTVQGLKDYVDTEIQKVEDIQTNVQNIEINLNTKLVNLDKAIEDSATAVQTANEAQSTANEAKAATEEAMKTAASAVTTANSVSGQIVNILSRLDALEKK